MVNAVKANRPSVIVELTFLPREAGGRATPPDPSSGRYLPHLVAVDDDRDASDYLGVRFVEGPTLIAGSPVRCTCELMYHPGVDYTALRPGTAVAVREGARTVARGFVLASPFERKETE